jgi:hypothetical protein
MSTKGVFCLVIFLIAGLVISYVMMNQQQRPQEEESPGSSLDEKAEETAWPGNVYWDKRMRGVRYQPCGQGVQEYRVQDEGIDNAQWSELVRTLRQMPQIPHFVVLAGEKEAGTVDTENVFRITRVMRIDPHGNCKEEHIVVTKPFPGQVVVSPLLIQGRARGTWFFEGDFPVLLTDWDGLIIAQGIARAKGEWMTKDFVPFVCRLQFEAPSFGRRGTLILRKDNPSDNPDLDDALEVPLRFY